MDLATITELITNLGLPVAMVVAMGLFIFKLWKQSAERETTLYNELAACREVNDKAISTIATYAGKLDAIQEDVKEIKGYLEH
jgi:hypothetical protein